MQRSVPLAPFTGRIHCEDIPNLTVPQDFENLSEAAAPYPFQNLVGRFVAFYEPRMLWHNELIGVQRLIDAIDLDFSASAF
jgi:hypothetical protein